MQLGLILVQLIRKLGLDYKNACLLVYHTKTFTPLNFYVVSWFKTCILNRIRRQMVKNLVVCKKCIHN